MANKVLKSAVTRVTTRRIKDIITIVMLVVTLSSICEFLIEPAYACVPEVGEIDVKESGNWVNRTNQTIDVALNSTVQFKAIPSPSEAQWPEGQPVWGGEATGQTGAEINVTFNSLGLKTVSAGTKYVSVNVVNVTIEKLRWKYHTDQTWADVSGTIYVPKGAQVDFMAIKTPSTAINWPTGKPVWGGTSGASGNSIGDISVTFSSTSSTSSDYKTVTCECGNTITANVVVVEIDKIQWRLSGGTYADVPGTLYVAKNSQVDFKAIIKPSGASWPSGQPVWTGATPDTPPDTASATFNSVSSSSTDYKTVTCACGNTKTVNVVVVEIDKIQWKYHSQSTYSDAPEILYIAKDAQVDFKAIIKPDNSSWPSGQPVWSGSSGASGTGSEVSVTFSSISSSSSDYKTVICSCGNSITVNVVVYKVNLKQLSFDGTKYHAVKRDTGNQDDYSAPHWQDNSSPPDGDADDAGDIKYPISFTRNTKMKVTTVCRADPAIAGVTIKVKGDGPGNLDFPETTASISDNDITIANVECSNPFVNEIDYFESLSIAWQYSYDNGSTWVSAGSSTNQTYITLGDPTATTYHTVLHIGCKNADGKTDAAEIVASIWGEFTDLEVKRADDNQTLVYYKTPFDSNCPYSVSGLLSGGDGRCGAWARFLRDIIKCQGITAVLKQIFITPLQGYNPTAMCVKNMNMASHPPEDLPGIAGQGSGNPSASCFVDHDVVYYDNSIYDPSYGKQFTTLLEWQMTSLEAIWYNGANYDYNINIGIFWQQLVYFGDDEP